METSNAEHRTSNIEVVPAFIPVFPTFDVRRWAFDVAFL